jgi:uncharacterized protein (DUF362 family)/ferredoxin
LDNFADLGWAVPIANELKAQSKIPRAYVAAALNSSHEDRSVRSSIRSLLDHLQPPIASQVNRGDRVLVKVNMGCTGVREPEQRFTSHPAYVAAVIEVLMDCGAKVSFGDDAARVGKYYEPLYEKTGMREVARRTGARLVDFVAVGAREIRGGLLIPRRYLVTNALLDADFVVNVANCRSHQGIGLSGAVKNMFGCVIGRRKLLIHNMFPGQPRAFSRVIADIYRTIKPGLSFLDLTSVVEGAGQELAIRPVGLMLASTDGVALDTLAAHAIGYEGLPLWIAHYGNKFGVGCNEIDRVCIRGIDWEAFQRPNLKHPWMHGKTTVPLYDRATAILNNAVLHPRPVISPEACTGCGDCAQRCPVNCIEPGRTGERYRIELSRCADCGCCLKVCDVGAVDLRFIGISKILRQVIHRMPESVDASPPTASDPSPMR